MRSEQSQPLISECPQGVRRPRVHDPGRVKSNPQERGTAIVEMALMLPLLLLMVMGLIEFGILAQASHSLQKAAREGARYGAVGQSQEEIRQRVIDAATGLDSANLTILISNAGGATGSPLTVDLTYDFRLITPLISTAIGGQHLDLKSVAVMRLE